MDRSKDPALELAMTVDGHKLWKYRNVANLPLFREIVTRVAYAKGEGCVRHDDAIVFTNMMGDLLNDGNNVQAIRLLGFYEDQLRAQISWRASMELGGYTVLIDDEAHDATTERHNALKTKLCEKYSTVADFFLSEGVGLMSVLNTGITASLAQAHLMDPNRLAREKVFLNAIQQPLFQGLWTVATPPPSGWRSKLLAILPTKS